MRRNPLYAFRDTTSVGIYSIPIHATVHILDQGNGRPIFIELIAKDGLHAGSTIGNLLANPDLYLVLGEGEEIPSELEKIEESGRTGWRLLGADTNNYGDIGQHAIDFSRSDSASIINGATGSNSLAAGVDTSASADSSAALGRGNRTDTVDSTVVGRFNDSTIINGLFVVGIGDADYARKNGLVVGVDGLIKAPECLASNIELGSNDTLTTKEYVDNVDGGDL